MQEEKKKIKLDFMRKMRKSKNYRQNAGITLIALVVTIIILLILAGVTISLVVGQNGLLQRAQIASNTMANASANETTQMGKFANDVNELTSGFLNDKGGSGETGGINWDTIKSTATKHPEQTGNNDIGIDGNGNPINLDLWIYTKDDDGVVLGDPYGGSDDNSIAYYPYRADWTIPNNLVGKIEYKDIICPSYIWFEGDDDFTEVVSLRWRSFLLF